MTTFLTFLPLIMVSVFVIFAGILVIADAKGRSTKRHKHKVSHKHAH